MELSPSSRLVRFAYFFKSYGPPTSTTLCAFFWRAFVIIPLIWTLIVVGAGSILYGLGRGTWLHPWIMLITVITLCLIVLFATYVEEADHIINAIDRIEASTFYQGLKSLKSKMCPVIWIR